ncbi:MAG: HPr family phosphocarrier protein [Planctomycetota bacterium]
MSEPPLERTVSEQDFAALLRGSAEPFLSTCAAPGGSAWTKRRFFDLAADADELESFLDDYGARTNRTFSAFTELVASVRGFALAGIRLAHLTRRIDAYGVLGRLGDGGKVARRDLETALEFVEDRIVELMGAILEEARRLRVTELSRGEGRRPVERFEGWHRLPHDVDLPRLDDDDHLVAGVATRYIEAVDMMREVGIRVIEEPEQREGFFRERCSEELARVREATVHNLQSSYDTYVKNTVLETGDPRLPELRGHISAALHTLEAVTLLTHFVERHERGLRSDAADSVLQRIVPRRSVRDVTLNRLLVCALAFMEAGAPLAEALLPSYTTASEAKLELRDNILLHARPASLIVAIVQHHGTPVELEVAGARCNAGSILELMVAIGSNPEAREFVVRGDERPLRDLVALFAADLGESGLEVLPDSLGYLRGR